MAGVVVGAAPAGAQSITASVSQTTDLVDGQAVEVSWSSEEPVGLKVCAGDACFEPSPPNADDFLSITTNPIEVPMPAAFRETNEGPLIDCRIEACELRVVAEGSSDVVPLQFDPTAPLLPDPELVVSPANGLTDAQLVDVTMPGPWGFDYVEQCTESGECVVDPAQQFELRNDAAVRVRSSIGGEDCEATCTLVANVYHPRVFSVTKPIALAPGTRPITDPELSFDDELTPGQSFTLNGSGFLPDTTFDVELCFASECEFFDEGQTDGGGTFSIPVTACAIRMTCEVKVEAFGDTATTRLFDNVGNEPFCDPVYDTTIDEGIPYRVAENHLGEQEELLLDASRSTTGCVPAPMGSSRPLKRSTTPTRTPPLRLSGSSTTPMSTASTPERSSSPGTRRGRSRR